MIAQSQVIITLRPWLGPYLTETLSPLMADLAVRLNGFSVKRDIGQMTDRAQFEERMRHVVSELHSAPKAKDAERIFIPGEMEWEKREKALRENRIQVTDVMVENLEKTSKLTNTSLTWLEE